MSDNKLRISCASLCRFLIDDRLLLLLNQNRREQGIYELSPLGGALEANDTSIFTRFDLQPENETSLDLRFFIDPTRLDDFRKWFHQREERETSPFREIREELVQEANVIDDIQPHDLRIFYRYTYETEKTTQRSGVSGQLTYYLLEIFEVWVISPMIKHRLHMLPQSSGVMLVNKNNARYTKTVQMTVDGETRNVELNVGALFQG